MFLSNKDYFLKNGFRFFKGIQKLFKAKFAEKQSCMKVELAIVILDIETNILYLIARNISPLKKFLVLHF